MKTFCRDLAAVASLVPAQVVHEHVGLLAERAGRPALPVRGPRHLLPEPEAQLAFQMSPEIARVDFAATPRARARLRVTQAQRRDVLGERLHFFFRLVFRIVKLTVGFLLN